VSPLWAKWEQAHCGQNPISGLHFRIWMYTTIIGLSMMGLLRLCPQRAHLPYFLHMPVGVMFAVGEKSWAFWCLGHAQFVWRHNQWSLCWFDRGLGLDSKVIIISWLISRTTTVAAGQSPLKYNSKIWCQFHWEIIFSKRSM